MDSNWYSPLHTPNSNGSWYASGRAAAPAAAPVKKKPRRWLKTILIVLGILALIAASCLVFGSGSGSSAPHAGFSFQWSDGRDGRDFSFSFPGGSPPTDEDGYYENFEDYFNNYFTAYEETEPCTIPGVDAPANWSIQLQEADESILSLQEIYNKCSPSIVAISAYTEEDNDDLYSWGTGVILSKDGYIVTNSHIVEGTCRAKITLQDDREFWAQLVGNDSRSDIAVLKIEAQGLTAAEFALSDSLQIGDDVVAIGNPLGDSFRCTMTNGIISGIDRDISYNGTTLTLIQTNAALNEGNSGGALINMAGQVIGITNMKMSNSYAGSVTIEGVGFAIPSITMKAMADGLLAEGRVSGRPALGITVGAIPDDAASHYDLPTGLYVNAVAEGSDCAAQGIRVGDVITHVNGRPAVTTADVTELIADMTVGETLTLSIFRSGENFDVTVALVDVNDVY